MDCHCRSEEILRIKGGEREKEWGLGEGVAEGWDGGGGRENSHHGDGDITKRLVRLPWMGVLFVRQQRQTTVWQKEALCGRISILLHLVFFSFFLELAALWFPPWPCISVCVGGQCSSRQFRELHQHTNNTVVAVCMWMTRRGQLKCAHWGVNGF